MSDFELMYVASITNELDTPIFHQTLQVFIFADVIRSFFKISIIFKDHAEREIGRYIAANSELPVVFTSSTSSITYGNAVLCHLA